jgi:hypothetical protein
MRPSPDAIRRDLKAIDEGDLAPLIAPIAEVRPRMPLRGVPRLAITAEGLHILPLDSRTAYLLSLLDGQCNLDTILDICDMARDEAVSILTHLLQLGVIKLDDPAT